jgi:hydroxymethylpyrimidine kinase/phosphomethylpyrimidine kinase
METSTTGADAVLTIAGHDGTNGAGITKDLEVFSHFGLFGVSAPTALVIQGPRGVRSIRSIDAEILSDMLGEIEKAFTLKGIKIGVVPDVLQIRAVAAFLERHRSAVVVFDPVMAAKNGLTLMTDSGRKVLKETLLPLVSCITPNLDETELLLDRKITDVEQMKEAAMDLSKMGPQSVIVKGGHLQGDPVDVLYDGIDTTVFEKRRIDKTVHGTGCLFSSTVLCYCVLGYSMMEAVFATEAKMEAYIESSFQPHSDGYSYVSVRHEYGVEPKQAAGI